MRTKPFDPSKYFDTEESRERLMADALVSGNTRYIEAAQSVAKKAATIAELTKMQSR